MAWAFVLLVLAAPAGASPIEADAAAFGTLSALWNLSLSPSGQKLFYVRMHASDVPVGAVYDFSTGQHSASGASEPGGLDLDWCGWATEERLVCSFDGVDVQAGVRFAFSRLIAVDADGSDMRNLGHQSDRQFMRVVDWLVDEPRRIMVPRSSTAGNGVVAMDIRTTRSDWVKRGRRDYFAWATDGRGNLRLRSRYEANEWAREALLSDGSTWVELYRQSKDTHRWQAIALGFGSNPDDLYVAKRVGARYSVWRVDLANDLAETPVFQHDEFDVADVVTIGKHQRVVGVSFVSDRSHVVYFDDRIREIAERASVSFPGRMTEVLAESWDRRFYIVSAFSDTDPGSFYRLDSEDGSMHEISRRYPSLEGRELSRVKIFRYEARDGVTVPAYVTLPAGKRIKRLPTVVLPHGGPESRDVWGFDWLAQYLAARGHLVLQPNFRGSGGYGLEWAGRGGYQDWKQAVDDIEDGIAALAEKGASDPERVCVVGWSYGGYAALMSAIEYPHRYRCAVSIAGVTDLDQLVDDARKFGSRRTRRSQVGDDPESRRAGSPAQRVDELAIPALLFHGEDDVNVYVEHGERFVQGAEKAGKQVELVTYEETGHSLDRNATRIDMLTRMGHFLEQHLSQPPESAVSASGPGGVASSKR